MRYHPMRHASRRSLALSSWIGLIAACGASSPGPGDDAGAADTRAPQDSNANGDTGGTSACAPECGASDCGQGAPCNSSVDCATGEKCTETSYDQGVAYCRPNCCSGTGAMCSGGWGRSSSLSSVDDDRTQGTKIVPSPCPLALLY